MQFGVNDETSWKDLFFNPKKPDSRITRKIFVMTCVLLFGFISYWIIDGVIQTFGDFITIGLLLLVGAVMFFLIAAGCVENFYKDYLADIGGDTKKVIRTVEQSSLGIRRTVEQIGIPRSTFYNWYGVLDTGKSLHRLQRVCVSRERANKCTPAPYDRSNIQNLTQFLLKLCHPYIRVIIGLLYLQESKKSGDLCGF